MAYPAGFGQEATHRLIPLQFAGEPPDPLPLPLDILADLKQLAAVTDDRKQAEKGRALGIGPAELLYAVPEAHIVNAVFCYPGPDGGRFHDRLRGAWYAGVEIDTSLAEVAYHKRRLLEQARFSNEASFLYQDFLADFSGVFMHLDEPEHTACLEAEPVPQCYGPGQALARSLLHAGASGIVYASVRHSGGKCIACFRPAMVFYPRRGSRYCLRVQAGQRWKSSAAAKVEDACLSG